MVAEKPNCEKISDGLDKLSSILETRAESEPPLYDTAETCRKKKKRSWGGEMP